MNIPSLSLAKILALIVLVLAVVSLFVTINATYFVAVLFILLALAVIL